MASTVDLALTISSSPPSGATFPTTTSSTPFNKSQSYLKSDVFTRSLAAAVDQTLLPTGWTKIQLIYVKVSGGNLTFKLTTGAGATQIVPCDDYWSWANMTQPLTALSVSGTGDLEVFAAGE